MRADEPLQQRVLTAIASDEDGLTYDQLARAVYGTDAPTRAQLSAIRRVGAALQEEGLARRAAYGNPVKLVPDDPAKKAAREAERTAFWKQWEEAKRAKAPEEALALIAAGVDKLKVLDPDQLQTWNERISALLEEWRPETGLQVVLRVTRS